MTDEEIIKLAEKIYKDKPQEGCVFCDDCPMFICANSKGCVLTAYEQGFLDGFKAATEYINQIPHFPLKHGNNTEIIEKFRDNPELFQTYLSEMEKNIQCIINGILSREK